MDIWEIGYGNVNKTELQGFEIPKAELLKIQFSKILAILAIIIVDVSVECGAPTCSVTVPVNTE
jgi:hypothetical protein